MTKPDPKSDQLSVRAELGTEARLERLAGAYTERLPGLAPPGGFTKADAHRRALEVGIRSEELRLGLEKAAEGE